MTTPFHDDASLTPPPGCPAHGLGAHGLRRLYGPEAEADPAGLYEKLRAEHGEVAPVLLHGDLPAWLILGHSANLTAMRTPSRFSRDSRRWTAFQQGLVTPDSPLMPVIAWQPLCVFADGEEQKRLRGAVTESLDRFDRRGIRRYVTRFTDQLIQDFGPSGQAELVAQFAEHLPMLVMTQVVGMPEEYGPRLVDAARDLMKGTETAVASNDYVVATLRRMMERKRVAPGADLVSWLMQHNAGLTDDEVLEHLRVVLLAANETTVNLIADTLKLVLTDRRFRAHLSGGHMTLPDALDQVLWDSPPMSLVAGRWATGDTELGGQQIKAGDMLLLGLAAGNVDPAVRPDLSEPLYGNRSHLAFGSGPHECPGQDIGRAIVETGIDILLTRLPDLQLAIPEAELTWTSAWISRHLVELPVRFTPRRKSEEEAPVAEGTAPTTPPATPPAMPATPQPDPTVPTAPAAGPAATATIPRQRRSWWDVLIGRFRR
ncbi:cytochrome P450 [Kitasatospora sp. GAS204B]|uniref:cytochrome P450 n=1 Tax=unclassified Kitasatospora TaxID=2633591 RepID=UPI00247543A5|nr:cytochrome P450 [Kitasatospora sp. GAS204B]MDH6119119.1 cytochrome P450 [Kitasatospora sp. GAS204B]